MIDIISALKDPRFFKPVFRDLETWRAWEVYLRALFGLPIEVGEDLKVFRECTSFDAPPAERARESFVVAGRRSGKSTIASLLAVYLATFRDWGKVLNLGEIGWIFILSVDKYQSRIIKNYVRAMLEASPHFRKLIRNETQEAINLKNQVSIAIKTASFRSVRGYTLLAAILEELAFWRSEESANPAQEVLAAVRPALATVPDSLLLGISTPYSRTGVLWEQMRAHFGKPGGPLIWKAPTIRMNPTISEDFINNAVREDYSAAKAEWLAEFRDDRESFLLGEVVESAVIADRWELPKLSGVEYFAFTDPSGGRADSFALAIAHKDRKTKRIILDRLEERCPPLKPQNVAEEYSKILKSYRIGRVTGDRYAGEWVVREFRDRGICYRPSALSKSEIYLEFEPLMAQGMVELLDNRKLVSQFRGLERRTRSGGKDSVDHYPGGNDDMANAAAGAMALASKGDSGRVRVRRLA